jgi:hypothetical protein
MDQKKVSMIILGFGGDQALLYKRPTGITDDTYFGRILPGASIRNTIDPMVSCAYRYARFLVSPDSYRRQGGKDEKMEGSGLKFRIDGLRVGDLILVEPGDAMGDRFGMLTDLGRMWIKLPRVFDQRDTIVLDATNLGTVACHLNASLLITMEVPAGDRAIGLDDFQARLRAPA